MASKNETKELDVSSTKIIKFSRAFAESGDDEIVISGMAGKFPNSHNIEEYEYNLYNKIDMVDDDERRWIHFNPEIPKRCGKIYDLEKFDATFFGVHYKQAHTMDPQTRILIETAYEAVMDAGVNPKSLRGTKTGVYIGGCISESEKTWFYERVSSGGFGITGCSRAMLANRISYCLGLNGPSFLVDTACSSSMYALDNAFSALRNGEIDAAIIGGANLILHPFVTLQFARLGVLAADGYCRPFDKKASGYTRSEAINCLFLQRKRVAKRIYATIVYSKTNCDGYKPEGITYPSGKMQEQLVTNFYNEINMKPDVLGYLEAHSTGTVVGDPEECSAIDEALCTKRNTPLLVGSVKSNIGHSEAASGICSLVKACLAFETGKIAPNINYSEIRPEIPALFEGRLVVVSDVMRLEKPFIGVNSFGFGGANAHVLLKGFDKPKKNKGIPHDDIPRLITWAGRTEDSVNHIFDAVEKKPLDSEFLALLYNIQKEEVSGMVFRGYGVFTKSDKTEVKTLARDVQHFTGIRRSIVWVFSGMGSQWFEMGASLMQVPVFKQSIIKCHTILESKDLDLINILTSPDSKMFDNIINCFVGIAAIQIALVDVLRSLNIEPDYIIGHSVGELGCGYADGCFSAEQMILAAYYRGKVSLETKKIKGSMAAIGMGYKQIVNILPDTIEVACRNSADSCTISGPAEDILKFITGLKSKGIFAKEVPCSNIPYHSRYITHLGPDFLKYLQNLIPNPAFRTKKWLSTSIPFCDWEQPGGNLCSAEYHANNLLNSVLFEDAFDLLPKDSLTIEIAPHGLLQAILKKSMPTGIHVPLTHRNNKNNALFFLTALGKLFINGITFPVENLYPKVEFPVSKGTPGISSLIKWDHSEDWFVTKYENMGNKLSGERLFTLNLSGDNYEFMSGHVIDGKVLVPATCYLEYVWETFSLMYHGPSYFNVPVEFEDIRFLRATNMSLNDNIELNVMIHYGTGQFEITESGNLVVTGCIREIESPTVPQVFDAYNKSDYPMLSKKDFYKELKLRGYHYNGNFRAVTLARGDGLYGRIEWIYNWATFMDAMLQIKILGTDSRTLLIPTKIRKLRINGPHHFELITKMDPENRVFDVFVEPNYDRIISGGIEVVGLHASPIQRRKAPGIPVLEKYEFIPYFSTFILGITESVRICIQLALENTPFLKMRIVEVASVSDVPIISKFFEALQDLPLVTGDFLLLTDQNIDDIPGVQIEHTKLTAQTNCHFIITNDIFRELNDEDINNAYTSLVENGYLVLRTKISLTRDSLKPFENFKLITCMQLGEDEQLILLQKEVDKLKSTPTIVQVSENDTEFRWIAEVQACLPNKNPIVLYSFNESRNGLIGLMNCLRKEPDGNLISCFYIDDENAPPFDLTTPFYSRQLALNLAINIYHKGVWGSYRHLQLKFDLQPRPRVDHIYGNIIQRGDLSTLHWLKGPLDSDKCSVRIAYASLNFRDVMLATGRLSLEIYGSGRLDQLCVLGLEFSGIYNNTGRRIMSMVSKAGVASYTEKPSTFMWDVPKHWTLQEAATVPVVYITVYYSFFMATDIRKGKSILIHAGTGGIGLAAIRVALAYKLEVFTTCSTPLKKEFLMKTFPELKESHIGNSRDISFETMIQRETNGKGVDFVLNSLAEDKLLASVRCLGYGGHFLEIGKFDMSNDNKLGMNCFLKEITFHAILADRLEFACEDDIRYLKNLVDVDIQKGIIQPLPSTIFPADEIEQAFRYLVGGKHIGKVLIKVRETPDSRETLPVRVLNQIYFKPNLSYIIVGGLGGFGLELADWLVIRGARKLILSSSRGISKDYQAYRIALWKAYGCEVMISTFDIATHEGCTELINQGINLAPIGGIFNLAVVLKDGIFINQTKEKFIESFAPKAVATQFLDEISRTLCPQLEHFVVFSSVSCGRGNAGQTNYGMANSKMERIIENRVKNGFSGKAIQWGAVGEVGLVADLAEDKIDMEIGGTLQQRISSCIFELDKLLSSADPIVSSMVVAEKNISSLGNKSIIETVMNIMSIRDLKSISLGSTLSEMGMDSLMAVEIKQTLERDFDLVLAPQDLRALTFQKLQEYADSRGKESADVAKIIFVSNKNLVGMEILVRNLGDESRCDEILIPLKTLADATKQSMPRNIIIPGLEGTAGQAWYNMGTYFNNNTLVLQLHKFAESSTIKELAEACFQHVKAVLKPADPFYIIGYSYGSLIGLQLAAMLEKTGYRGRLLLIDGAPHFLKQLTLAHLGDNFTDNDIYDLLFTSIVKQIFPEEPQESVFVEFKELNQLSDKMNRFMEYANKQFVYSKEYAKTVVQAMFRRIRMAVDYDVDQIDALTTPIVLVRPTEVSLQDIEEDYCLSKITSGKIVIKVIEGNHTSMLDNPRLPQIINDINPTLQDDKDFEKYIHGVKNVAAVT